MQNSGLEIVAGLTRPLTRGKQARTLNKTALSSLPTWGHSL